MPLLFETYSLAWVSLPLWMPDIRVGFLIDPLGVFLSALGVLLVLLSTFHEKTNFPSQGMWRAVFFTTLGISIAWLSSTVWLVLIGLFLAILGGVASLWDSKSTEEGAYLLGRYLQERASGVVLCFAGACFLMGGGALLGVLILFGGVLIQFQPFPFQGWILKDAPQSKSKKLLFPQVFTAFAAYAVCIRFRENFQSSGFYKAMGWAALILGVLLLIVGLFQEKEHTQKKLGLWVSSSFLGAISALVFAGPVAGLSVFMGAIFSAVSLVLIDSVSESKKPEKNNKRERLEAQICVVFAGLVGSGLLGVILTRGRLEARVVITLVAALQSILLWQVCWGLIYKKGLCGITWALKSTLLLIFTASIGVYWLGALQGGRLLFLNERPLVDGITVTLQFFVLGVGACAAYFYTNRKKGKSEGFFSAFPRGVLFCKSGYALPPVLFKFFRRGVVELLKTEKRVQKVLGPEGVGVLSKKAIFLFGVGMNELSGSFSVFLNASLSRAIRVPGKTLQLIQNGSVQWYLFFALGTGIAFLLHFIRKG